MIAEPARAKINLALHVRHRRADGYHALETLFAFARDGDLVTLAPADADTFAITGPEAGALDPGGNNLVTRARDGFRTAIAPVGPVAITLDKRLPVAAGIGGGSADAAATLRGLSRLAGMDPLDPRLFALAETLGADVPACLLGRTALGTGKGEALAPLDDTLAGTPLLLVNPRVPVSTAAVFARWDGIDRGGIPGGALLDRARDGRNDLEPPARALAPAIDAVLDRLGDAPGVLLARMSGSGATCFALFSDAAHRDAARDRAAAQGWWTLATAVA